MKSSNYATINGILSTANDAENIITLVMAEGRWKHSGIIWGADHDLASQSDVVASVSYFRLGHDLIVCLADLHEVQTNDPIFHACIGVGENQTDAFNNCLGFDIEAVRRTAERENVINEFIDSRRKRIDTIISGIKISIFEYNK